MYLVKTIKGDITKVTDVQAIVNAAHKYFAFGSLICMIMAVYSGHKMISGNKRRRKQMELKEVEE